MNAIPRMRSQKVASSTVSSAVQYGCFRVVTEAARKADGADLHGLTYTRELG